MHVRYPLFIIPTIFLMQFGIPVEAPPAVIEYNDIKVYFVTLF